MQWWWRWLGQHARLDSRHPAAEQTHGSSSSLPAKQPAGLRARVSVAGSRHSEFWVSARHTAPTRRQGEALLRYCQCTLQRSSPTPGHAALLRDRLRLSRRCLQDHAAPRQPLYNPPKPKEPAMYLLCVSCKRAD